MNKNENLIGYSLALFSIAKEENKVQEYFGDAKVLLSLFSTPDYLVFIDIISSKDLSKLQKEKIIDETFKKMDLYFLNFLKLLATNNKFQWVKNIINLFINYCCDYLKIKEGTIYSSSLLSAANIKAIENKLSTQLESKVSLKNLLDKELISGIKIVIDNTIIENSIVSDLEEMKEMLKGTKKWD